MYFLGGRLSGIILLLGVLTQGWPGNSPQEPRHGPTFGSWPNKQEEHIIRDPTKRIQLTAKFHYVKATE